MVCCSAKRYHLAESRWVRFVILLSIPPALHGNEMDFCRELLRHPKCLEFTVNSRLGSGAFPPIKYSKLCFRASAVFEIGSGAPCLLHCAFCIVNCVLAQRHLRSWSELFAVPRALPSSDDSAFLSVNLTNYFSSDARRYCFCLNRSHVTCPPTLSSKALFRSLSILVQRQLCLPPLQPLLP